MMNAARGKSGPASTASSASDGRPVDPAPDRVRAVGVETAREEVRGASEGRGRGPQPAERERRRRVRLSTLSLPVRVALFLVGWLLLLTGIAGLFLPVLQGALMIVAGAAVLSLVSELVYEWLRLGLRRWPTLWRRVEGARLRLHRRLRRRSARPSAAPPKAKDD